MGLDKSFKMNSVLITGSNGFLGNNIFNAFSRKNNVFSLNRTNSDYNYNIVEDNIEFDRNFDIVVHCAGLAHRNSMLDQHNDLFDKVNVQGTINILNGINKINLPKTFIYISSVSVYGLDYGDNINENVPLMATDQYGISKIKTEEIIIDWAEKNNVQYLILRLPLVVGFNPPGNLGSMINYLKKGMYFNVAGGLAKKSMVLASDVSNLLCNLSYKQSGIFNLTDGYHPNFSELSQCIAKSLKVPPPRNLPIELAKVVAFVGDIFGATFPMNSKKLFKMVNQLTFNDEKARQMLNWNPNLVLDFENFI